MTIIDLENKDILQINATIIAGALIFLTFLSFSTSAEAENRVLGIIVGSGTILIFSISSLQVISGKKPSAISAMRAAYVLLIAVAIVFVIFTLLLTSHIYHPAGSSKVASSHWQVLKNSSAAIHIINRSR
jgi:hypothetical protein